MKARSYCVQLAGVLFASIALSACDNQSVETANFPTGAQQTASEAGPNEIGLSPKKHRPSALPLNNPSFVPGTVASYMQPEDMVVGVVIRGKARAYPWWVVINHHVINDTVAESVEDIAGTIKSQEGDYWAQFVQRPSPEELREAYIPLLVTLCEACSGASAYVPIPESGGERPLVFAQCKSKGSAPDSYSAIGVYTICDMQTQSRWHPFTGKAYSGLLQGQQLQRIPVSVEKWQDWLKLWPDTAVVAAGVDMRMRTHARINGNFMGAIEMHPTLKKWRKANPDLVDRRIPINTLVLGMKSESAKKALAYPLKQLQKAGGYDQLEHEGRPYLFVATGSFRGAVFHREHKGQVLNLTLESATPLLLRDQQGNIWNELGEAVTGPATGDRMAMVPDSYLAEWSEWIMEHAGAEIVQ